MNDAKERDGDECVDIASQKNDDKTDLDYTINQVPPWYACILLGLQQYLVAFGSNILKPLLLAKVMCMGDDHVALSQIIDATFVASGVATVLQSTLGSRLPIVQGASSAFFLAAMSILSQPKWACPMTNHTVSFNDTQIEDAGEVWKSRMRELQGAIMVSAVVEVVLGCTGVFGCLLSRIGPLTITPTITLICLSLADLIANMAAKQWWIAIMTVALITLFSQFIGDLNVPCYYYSRNNGCSKKTTKMFRLVPVMLGMSISWFICYILTITDVLSPVVDHWGHAARTDARSDALEKSAWFRFPIPVPWGSPTFTLGTIFGMSAAMFSSVVESIGDYYSAASISGALPPPVHAVNRGIGVEGLCSLVAGILGSGNALTSFSGNIGAISITRVGSRRVIQVAGIIMIFLGCCSKFGAVVITLPDPVLGGTTIVTIGLVGAVGLSNLKSIPMTGRNLFILGLSLIVGLALPRWVGRNRHAINLGNYVVNDIAVNLMSNSLFVGGILGFLLDNLIKGTKKERGIDKRSVVNEDNDNISGYDIPYIQRHLLKYEWTRHVPISPTYRLPKHKFRTSNEIVDCNIGLSNMDQV